MTIIYPSIGLYSLKNCHNPFGKGFQPFPFLALMAKFQLNMHFLDWGLPFNIWWIGVAWLCPLNCTPALCMTSSLPSVVWSTRLGTVGGRGWWSMGEVAGYDALLPLVVVSNARHRFPRQTRMHGPQTSKQAWISINYFISFSSRGMFLIMLFSSELICH